MLNNPALNNQALSPDDVAHVISFLVSEGAGFVSGQVIYVAGGPLC